MFEKELFSLILQDFPESLIITLICFDLLNLKFVFKKIMIISLLQTLTNLVRLLPIAFGMHTIILTISLALYIRITTGKKLSSIFLAVITCVFVILASQAVYFKPMLNYLGVSYQDMVWSPVLRAVFSLPEYAALLLIPAAKRIYLHLQKQQKAPSQS
ncbi:MAG TPA: hypothetical protein PK728_06135 [Bacillota bacterium]|nr:hypothetical protein [Bacillota bacterium]